MAELFGILDLSKAWPTFLAHFGVAAQLFAPLVFQYTRSTEDGLAVLQHLENLSGGSFSKSDFKLITNSFPMGGAVPERVPPGPARQWLERYQRQILYIRAAVLQAFPEFLEWAELAL